MQSHNVFLKLPVRSSSGPLHRTRKALPYLSLDVIATYALRFESGGREAENGVWFPFPAPGGLSSGKVRLSPYKAPTT